MSATFGREYELPDPPRHPSQRTLAAISDALVGASDELIRLRVIDTLPGVEDDG